MRTPDRNIWFVSTSNAMLIENENAASADESLCGLYKRLSKEGRRADALALRADEGRDKLRKASGRGKYPLIRRSPNGATHTDRLCVPYDKSIVIRG